MRHRPAARIILLNPRNEVLLFRFAFTPAGGMPLDYWASVGGAVEPGETVAEAALRELYEETGIAATDLGAPIGQDSFPLVLETGETVLAIETFFGHRTGHSDIQKTNWTPAERQIMVDHRWWSTQALCETQEQVFPQSLLTLMARVP